MFNQRGKAFVAVLPILGIIVFVTTIALALWGCPKYGVYRKTLRGEASLKEAEWDRQIRIKESQARKESATYEKQADSIRAEGTAIANEIIAKSLTTQYIQWKWVEGLQDGSSEVIYIPTEAQLPILEAVRKSK